MTDYERKLILSMRLEVCDNCALYPEEWCDDEYIHCRSCPVFKLISLAEKEEKKHDSSS